VRSDRWSWVTARRGGAHTVAVMPTGLLAVAAVTPGPQPGPQQIVAGFETTFDDHQSQRR
jgi:hypothetical protein